MKKIHVYLLGLSLVATACKTRLYQSTIVNEEHRPQFHFSPPKNWMNDPNGMVYLNGKYHLFYQHHPQGTKWGPMHWGHAISKDLIHWEHQPIALYPDSLGTIFSGSAVYDKNNTSGLGKNGKAPLVAIFTHHNRNLESQGRKDFQYQSIAYSLDEGKTWTKYARNPVVKNPGIVDFRDPKVRWYEQGRKWIMTLATKDRVTFYSSPNLLTWTKESEFGEKLGAHGGVWECPDLFPLDLDGQKKWVLLVSINPGAPNKGSGTQYFVGDFDGNKFVPDSQETKWVDWGTDNYAGVTWSNTGDRTIFLGWMSNWQYAEVVPTQNWRSAMTLPRELSLKTINNSVFLASQPVVEFSKIVKPASSADVTVNGTLDLSDKIKNFNSQFQVEFKSESLEGYSIVLSNDLGEELLIGYDKNKDEYYVDRSKAGKVSFERGFGARHTAPRIAKTSGTSVKLIVDVASVELFADDGLSVMTDIVFPTRTFNKLEIRSVIPYQIRNLSIASIKGIW